MGSYKWWMLFTSAYWEYKANSDHYGRWWNNDEIKPYITPEMTTKGGEHIIFTDNGDKDIGKWWQDYRILLNVDAEKGVYDTDGTLTYSISGGHSNDLYINPTWGNVTFKGGGGADLSTRLNQYNFTVTATSSSHLTPAVSKHFQLKIIQGEYKPKFISSDDVSTSYNEIIETAANENIAVEEYMAVLDVDAVEGNHSYQFGGAGIHYSITGGSSFLLNVHEYVTVVSGGYEIIRTKYVKIDQDTGVVSLNMKAFFLDKVAANLQITATALDDEGNLTQYSTTQNVDISLKSDLPVIVENVIYANDPVFITDMSEIVNIVVEQGIEVSQVSEDLEHEIIYEINDHQFYDMTGFYVSDEGVVSYTGQSFLGTRSTISYEDTNHYVVVGVKVPTLNINKIYAISYDVIDVNEGINNSKLLGTVFVEEHVFGARQYNLNDYFTDLDGDELIFSVENQIENNMNAWQKSVSFAGVLDNVLYVDFQLSAQSSFVIEVSATDGEFTAYDTLVIDVV